MNKKIFEHQVDFYDAIDWELNGRTLRETLCKKAWDHFRPTIDLFLWIWLYNNNDTSAEIELDFPTIKVEIWQGEKVYAEP